MLKVAICLLDSFVINPQNREVSLCSEKLINKFDFSLALSKLKLFGIQKRKENKFSFRFSLILS